VLINTNLPAEVFALAEKCIKGGRIACNASEGADDDKYYALAVSL